MKRVMLDFETLGNGKHACIVQAGACYFDVATEGVNQCLSLNIDAEDATRHGAEIDASTVYWWLKQSPEAIKSIVEGDKYTEQNGLELLNAFLAGADEIWSHATFDFVILTEALRRRGIKPQFHYRAARDIRTLNALAPYDRDGLVREGIHHNALDDAIYQARYVMQMLKKVGAP